MWGVGCKAQWLVEKLKLSTFLPLAQVASRGERWRRALETVRVQLSRPGESAGARLPGDRGYFNPWSRYSMLFSACALIIGRPIMQPTTPTGEPMSARAIRVMDGQI
jgi:hypothetical protein